MSPVADDRTAADLVLLNGTVLTLDPMGSRTEAVAVRQGRIADLGSDRSIAKLVGDRTEVLDLQGRTAIPGFVESHNHPTFFGLTLAAQVDAGTPPNETIAHVVERVAAAARDVAPGEWIRGYRYDDTLLKDNRHPTRQDLDRAAPHNPVALTHVSGHFCVVNSKGLRVAGIDATTSDPPGGEPSAATRAGSRPACCWRPPRS